MALGSIIAQVRVTGPDEVKIVQPVVEKFGGNFLVRGTRTQSPDGTLPGNRTCVTRFPSCDSAPEWDRSDAPAPGSAHVRIDKFSDNCGGN